MLLIFKKIGQFFGTTKVTSRRMFLALLCTLTCLDGYAQNVVKVEVQNSWSKPAWRVQTAVTKQANGSITGNAAANAALNNSPYTTWATYEGSFNLANLPTPDQFNGISIDKDGNFVIPANLAPGVYGFGYGFTNDTNYLYAMCKDYDPAEGSCRNYPNEAVSFFLSFRITVSGPPVVAADDAYTLPNQGGMTASVFVNDTLSGAVPTSGTVAISWNGTSVPGLTLNANGTITVAANKTAGTYSVPYKICDTANVTNCATATATVTVQAANPIVANADSYVLPSTGGATASVFANDTLSGAAPTSSLVTISWNGPAVSGITLNSSGVIDVISGKAGGVYWVPYKICETLDPINCSVASASVTVTNPITAAGDSFTMNYGGGTTLSVFTNDALAGAVPNANTATATTGQNVGLVMNVDGTISVAADKLPGTYQVPYTLCEKSAETNCASAVAAITVKPAQIGQCLPIPAPVSVEGGIDGDGGAFAVQATWSIASQNCALVQQLYTTLSMNADITSVYSVNAKIGKVGDNGAVTPIDTDVAGSFSADSKFISSGGLTIKGSNVNLAPGNYVLQSSIRYTDAAITAAGYDIGSNGFDIANFTSSTVAYPFVISCLPPAVESGGLTTNGNGQTLALVVKRSACNGNIGVSISVASTVLQASSASKIDRSISANRVAGFVVDLSSANLVDGDYVGTVKITSDSSTTQSSGLNFTISSGKVIPRVAIAKAGSAINSSDANSTDSLGRIGVIPRLPASVPGIQR